MYDWDEAKRRANLAKHGVDFADMAMFDWPGAVVLEDDRRNYKERRLSATGHILGRLHVCIFTPRGGRLRIISLRKANRRDKREWESKRNL